MKILTLASVGHVSWFVFWGTLGYFFGLRGVGFGWPAFWGVGGTALACVGVAWVIVALVFWSWREENE